MKVFFQSGLTVRHCRIVLKPSQSIRRFSDPTFLCAFLIPSSKYSNYIIVCVDGPVVLVSSIMTCSMHVMDVITLIACGHCSESFMYILFICPIAPYVLAQTDINHDRSLAISRNIYSSYSLLDNLLL